MPQLNPLVFEVSHDSYQFEKIFVKHIATDLGEGWTVISGNLYMNEDGEFEMYCNELNVRPAFTSPEEAYKVLTDTYDL